MKLKATLLAFVAGVGATALGAYALWPEPKTPIVVQGLPPNFHDEGDVKDGSDHLTKEQIASLVSRAVDRRLQQHPVNGNMPTAAEEKPSRTEPPKPVGPLSDAAINGTNLLQSAREHREWTAEDKLIFKAQLTEMDDDERHALMAEFARALTNQEFESKTFPPL